MKPALKSKTIWFNFLAVLVLISNQFGFADFQLDAETTAGIIAIVNFVLRFWTDKAISVPFLSKA